MADRPAGVRRVVVWAVAVPVLGRAVLSLVDYLASRPTPADFVLMTGFFFLVVAALAALVGLVVWLSRNQLRRVRRLDPGCHASVVAVALDGRWRVLVVDDEEIRLMTLWRGSTDRSWRTDNVRSVSLAPVGKLLVGRTRTSSYPGVRLRFLAAPEIDLGFPGFGLWISKKPQQAQQTQIAICRAVANAHRTDPPAHSRGDRRRRA